MTCRDEVGRSYYIAAEALDKHRGDVSSHAALLQISPRPATSAADLYPWIPSNAKWTGSSHLPEEQEGDKRLPWHRCTTPNDHPHLICQRLDAIGDGTKGEVEWLHESRLIDRRWGFVLNMRRMIERWRSQREPANENEVIRKTMRPFYPFGQPIRQVVRGVPRFRVFFALTELGGFEVRSL
ncbi:uncharacterized protein RSE6_04637 [Rhynchosporium secalis]|uniref:Uncharacterized protein n=1 Tax=Rhynchosporium secalis TaxID=38038 RepID=A0A1E1M5T9_RHYSE|nr:uncharacterized protein RSE6_04637 [Rhynchosporium secalis]